MKRLAGRWLWLIPAALCAICLWKGAVYAERLGGTGNYTQLVLNTQMSFNQARELLQHGEDEKEPISMVFWRQEEDGSVHTQELGRSAEADVLTAAGQIEILYGENSVLAEGDTEGCLLSSDVAQELFGNVNVLENEVFIDGEKYRIRGVLKSVEDLAVVRGKAGSQANTVQDQEDMTHGFDRVKVRNQGAKSTKEMKKLLETRCGVEGTVLDLPLLGRISRIAVWIPPLFMCLHFLVWLFGNARNTERLRERFFWRGFAAVFTVLILYLAASQISIPKDIVPSRWSDFEFFSNLGDEISRAIFFLMDSQKTAPEVMYFHAFFQSLVFVGISIGMYLLTFLCRIVFRRNDYDRI
ncbi:MAG: ABC transporter permease [Lachnospiraceae bacterium]|jgi:hypothetical protein|nr:ABC transporter permease [Lachnospiraceae bacterium]